MAVMEDQARHALDLFEQAVDLPAIERPAFLDRACRGDDALRRQVDTLIAADVDAGSFGGAPHDLAAEASSSGKRLDAGARLGPYVVKRALGHGGMGEVYLGRDTRLHRLVAIKVLLPRERDHVVDEARAVAALNHPHICTLYDVGDDYLVMEFVDGETLASVLARGPLPVDRAVRYAAEIAGALAAAHAAGIVHRDLKPANVMVTASGVKVLDFGLARRVAPTDPDAPTRTAHLQEPMAMDIAGTTSYMSPEQAEGRRQDARSDIWALGVVLYEMVCGRRPFAAETPLATVAAILEASPERPSRYRREVPDSVERIIGRCLQKDPANRYGSASDVARELTGLVSPPTRRRILAIALAVLVVGATAGAIGLMAIRSARLVQWAETSAPAEIERLIADERRMAAYRIYREALRHSPGSAALLAIGLQSTPVAITTIPSGARISVMDYVDGASPHPVWTLVGTSPVSTSILPRGGYYRVLVEKDGFEPVELTLEGNAQLPDILLHERGTAPPGMVWIPGAAAGTPVLANRLPLPADLDGYWIDRFEVTNRNFKVFVDAGGYRTPSHWAQFVDSEGKSVDWVRAMSRFVDATGLPGPAAWRFGNYPEGDADLPVTGVSWYEAAAYAAFRGKALPSLYHWYRASGAGFYSNIVALSNFDGRAPDSVGRRRGLSRFGAYDQAGNVKEWVANAAGDLSAPRRFVLGGSWAENPYTFVHPDVSDVWERNSTIGFRCARWSTALDSALTSLITRIGGEVRTDPPVADAEYGIYERLHDYDRRDLSPIVERVDERSTAVRRETVSYMGAGGGRTLAHVFLPRGVDPPYQLVVVVPTANIIRARSIDALYDRFDFLAQAGRAVIVPVLEHTLERGDGGPVPPGRNAERDRLLTWSREIRRALDYAERRPDIDSTRVAYFGISMGAVLAPTFVAGEPRFDTAVLLSGGTVPATAPEVDPWNYAPRVTIPILMLNGRDDFIYPAETHQRPLFDAFGTPAANKRRSVHDGGHVNLMIRLDVIREILGWLDAHLGPPR
jgi:formylglycine-generating enzyme required for sulfatase activity/tRNA A-37 threonylcarbamoyl transferase component Bud32/dienelactone hydrolase